MAKIVLHRGRSAPEALRYRGRAMCAYWFEYQDRYWGVSREMWDHGTVWEVFDAENVVAVRDDYDTLAQVRREAPDDCDMYLVDLAAEEADHG